MVLNWGSNEPQGFAEPDSGVRRSSRHTRLIQQKSDGFAITNHYNLFGLCEDHVSMICFFKTAVDAQFIWRTSNVLDALCGRFDNLGFAEGLQINVWVRQFSKG